MKIIKEGCPFCHGDVAGEEDIKFYCKGCNLLFSLDNLKISPAESE